MKLKIVSDGTVEGTKVETEDGRTVDNVTSISFNVDTKNDAVAHLTVANPGAYIWINEDSVHLWPEQEDE